MAAAKTFGAKEEMYRTGTKTPSPEHDGSVAASGAQRQPERKSRKLWTNTLVNEYVSIHTHTHTHVIYTRVEQPACFRELLGSVQTYSHSITKGKLH